METEDICEDTRESRRPATSALKRRERGGGKVRPERINTTEMTVVMANDFVLFEVPTFDHLILPTTEEIRMPIGDSEATNGGDVTCERELECTACRIPDFDYSISSTGGEPLVSWFASC